MAPGRLLALRGSETRRARTIQSYFSATGLKPSSGSPTNECDSFTPLSRPTIDSLGLAGVERQGHVEVLGHFGRRQVERVPSLRAARDQRVRKQRSP